VFFLSLKERELGVLKEDGAGEICKPQLVGKAALHVLTYFLYF
jgi:hypothetical protein